MRCNGSYRTPEKLTGKKYNLNNLADVYEAIHVIQTELDITGTTAKEASTTLQGSASANEGSIYQCAGSDCSATVLTGPLTGMGSSLVTFAQNLLPMISNILQSLPKAIVEVLGSAGAELA